MPRSLGASCQGEVDRARELRRQVAARARERRQRAADAADGRGGRGAAHGVDAGERLVEDERQRVEVRLLADLASLALLGRHVGERAEHVAGARERVLADEAGAAEVGELGGGGERLRRRRAILARVRDEHVLRLDVAMDHAARVSVLERAGEREADLQHLLVLELVRRDQPRERVAVDELGDQVERVIVGARLVQRDDRRVREPRRGERLAGRALAVAGRAEQACA